VTVKQLIEYAELFEKSENELFGKDGYETILQKVIVIEKKLNIDNLQIYTPKFKII
jgi:hypothetical protein